MSSPRLRTQFEKLFEHFKGQDSDIQLDEVISVLYCTRRNARIVLNKMADEGWIEWHPAAGRGNLSRIIFKRNQQDVSENLATQYLMKGRIDQAFNVLNKDTARLIRVMSDYFGIKPLDDRLVLRLPYYRQLFMLNPLKAERRAEQNIISQIFSGLTRLDDNEQLQPDLAHHWESPDGLSWTFYLRPGVRFHNGDLLSSNHVAESLTLSSSSALFSHIKQIRSPAPLVVKVELSDADWQFPLFLAEPVAKIKWSQEPHDDFESLPAGTGPFKVVLNDEKQLRLQAFDHYFGYRPLLDRVDIQIIDEAYTRLAFPGLGHAIKFQKSIKSQKRADNAAKLDPECCFLLLNRKHGLAKQSLWANYFCSALSSFRLYRLLPEEHIVEPGLLPAYGLKAGWRHHLTYEEGEHEKILPPQQEIVTIAFDYRHPLFTAVAKVIATVLSHDGLSVEFRKYQHTIDDPDSVDIWLKSTEIVSDRDDALAGWLLGYSQISELSNEVNFKHWQNIIQEWRNEKQATFPAEMLGRSLIDSQQIIPLFHYWLDNNQDQCALMAGFSQLWVKP